MPIRFSTEAANADILGDDSEATGGFKGMPKAVGADGTPRSRADWEPPRPSQSHAAKKSEAPPGKDAGAAGSANAEDRAKP